MAPPPTLPNTHTRLDELRARIRWRTKHHYPQPDDDPDHHADDTA